MRSRLAARSTSVRAHRGHRVKRDTTKPGRYRSLRWTWYAELRQCRQRKASEYSTFSKGVRWRRTRCRPQAGQSTISIVHVRHLSAMDSMGYALSPLYKTTEV